MPRVKNGKFILLPITDQTRGHGTHSLPAIWKDLPRGFSEDAAARQLNDHSPLAANDMNSSSSRPCPCRCSLTPCLAVAAQPRTIAPVVLTLPSGPRTLALGNVGVASRDDDVLFFNPAQLVVARGFSTSGERYRRRRERGRLSSVTRFSTGGIAIGCDDAPTFDSPLGGVPDHSRGPWSAGGPVIGSSLEPERRSRARSFKGIRIGGAGEVRRGNESDASRTRARLFDLGVSKVMFGSATPFGARGAEPRAGRRACQAPVEARASVAYRRECRSGRRSARPGRLELDHVRLHRDAAVSVLRDAIRSRPRADVEVNYSWLDGYNIALRAGARRPLPGEEAFTAGAGFTMDRLSIDYALETLSGSRVGQSHRASDSLASPIFPAPTHAPSPLALARSRRRVHAGAQADQGRLAGRPLAPADHRAEPRREGHASPSRRCTTAAAPTSAAPSSATR